MEINVGAIRDIFSTTKGWLLVKIYRPNVCRVASGAVTRQTLKDFGISSGCSGGKVYVG